MLNDGWFHAHVILVSIGNRHPDQSTWLRSENQRPWTDWKTQMHSIASSINSFLRVALLLLPLAVGTAETIAQEIDFSTLSKDKFVARVQLLMHEARRFETKGDLRSSYELAVRADSILATIRRTSEARLPATNETPADLIARLRKKAAKTRQVTAKQPNQSAKPKQSKQLAQVKPQQVRPQQRPRPPVKPAAQSPIATAPQLLLEQLDRQNGQWQSIDDPSPKFTNSTDSVANNNSDPFANKPPIETNEPSLLLPNDQGHRVARIPTQIADESKPSRNRVADKDDGPVFETPSAVASGNSATQKAAIPAPPLESAPFELEIDGSKAAPAWIALNENKTEPTKTGSPASQSSSPKVEHAHSDEMLLWVAGGIVLTLVAIWVFRVILQTVFGVRMKLDIHGKVAGASGAKKVLANQIQPSENTQSKTIQTAALASQVSNDSLESFPFRLVGASTDDASDEPDTTQSKQEILRKVYADNIELQEDRRDAA
jgi:hypothetical protein